MAVHSIMPHKVYVVKVRLGSSISLYSSVLTYIYELLHVRCIWVVVYVVGGTRHGLF